jgi:chemotaxis protein CheC
LITLEGEINGMMMFLMEQSSAHHLLNILMGTSLDQDTEFSEMDLSALKEIGNIISGAYLTSLSTLTNIRIDSSIPYMSIDMAGAILSVPAIEFGKVGDKALIIETQFLKDDSDVNGYFILIPSLESYDAILTSLGL